MYTIIKLIGVIVMKKIVIFFIALFMLITVENVAKAEATVDKNN